MQVCDKITNPLKTVQIGFKTFTLLENGSIECMRKLLCKGGVFAGNLNQDTLLSATPGIFEKTCRSWLRDHLVSSKYIRLGKFHRPRFDANFLIANPSLRSYFAMCIADRETKPNGNRRSRVEELARLIDDQNIN